MTREEIREDILNLKSNYILAELPTSLGKSKIALDFMNEKAIEGRILIVIPRLVLINNWKAEFAKWHYTQYLPQVTFSTYVSLPKHVEEHYDLIIFDECHHLSERAQDAVLDILADYCILLSATVKKEFKQELVSLFPGIEMYKISMRKAIDESILPDPTVYLMPLKLDDTANTQTIIINPKAPNYAGIIPYNKRFSARRDKNRKYIVQCTELEYYQDLSSTVEYYKKVYFKTNNQIMYFKWQQKAKERLLWLASLKNNIVKKLLNELEDKRTLTFCSSIAQTEELGQYCINSENPDSDKILDAFNNKEINHITACNILNEGANLTDCQVGIFVSINSSDIMTKQKNGRILRHPKPIIYIPYYTNTREEEIVKNIVQNYNPDLITVIENL